MPKVMINGRLVDKEDGKISVLDNGLLFGDGVFEGIRVYRRKPFMLRAHLVRLAESAKSIRLTLPIEIDRLANDVVRTVRENSIVEGYVRLVVTRGGGVSPGFEPVSKCPPSVIIIAEQIELYPQSVYEGGLRLITATTIRNPETALSPRVKSLNYLNNILAKVEATDAGCREAIMLNHRGEVAECTADNIFVVVNAALITPPNNAGILEGITRQIIIEQARKHGMHVSESSLTQADLYKASECFITGTAAEVVPVVEIDGNSIGDGEPGPITKNLIKRFHEYVDECQSGLYEMVL